MTEGRVSRGDDTIIFHRRTAAPSRATTPVNARHATFKMSVRNNSSTGVEPMGRPSTDRTARARDFGRWSGGLCTHLDGEALIMLLKQLQDGRRPKRHGVRVEFG